MGESRRRRERKAAEALLANGETSRVKTLRKNIAKANQDMIPRRNLMLFRQFIALSNLLLIHQLAKARHKEQFVIGTNKNSLPQPG